MFFFKQKTAYDMRISDWSSDVCSSDLYLIAVVSNLVYLIVFLTEIRSSLVSRSIKMPCGSAADKEARSDQDRITPGRGKRCPAPPFHPLRSRRRRPKKQTGDSPGPAEKRKPRRVAVENVSHTGRVSALAPKRT